MTALTFPCTVFATQRKMDDRAAADMQYGDLTASELQKRYLLTDVSEKVDPYTGIRLTPFNVPQSRFYIPPTIKNTGACSPAACAALLFDEMRSLSWPFSVYSPYRQLINKMIDHMQHANGAPFSDAALDMALKNQILEDNSGKSSLKIIESVINNGINYKEKRFPEGKIRDFETSIQTTILPKFVRKEDSINGLGITVHDIYSIEVRIMSLKVCESSWEAKIQYIAQDHFGLDHNDIMKDKFRQFKFFRIWFVLQHFERYGYKPFFTNMNALINLSGRKK